VKAALHITQKLNYERRGNEGSTVNGWHLMFNSSKNIVIRPIAADERLDGQNEGREHGGGKKGRGDSAGLFVNDWQQTSLVRLPQPGYFRCPSS
jgi:hypothetical protein